MSAHFHLWCKETDEATETIAIVGDKTFPRIEANALSAFLLYHFTVAPGAELKIVELDGYPDLKERNTCDSLKALEQEIESIGDFEGYEKPIMLWTESNYHEFISREPGLANMLRDFEDRASVWVKK